MNQLPIESIKVTRVAAKGGFKDNLPNETAFLFLEQFFDKKNNKTKEIILSEEGDEEQIIIYEYDTDGKLISEQHHFLFDEIEEKTIFNYNNDLLIEKKKEYSYGNIETTLFSFDENKQPTSIKVIDEEGEEEESELFEYQGKNLVHYLKQNALIGKDIEAWFKYDDKNRVIEEKKWNNTNLKTFITQFEYSKSETDPDIKIINDKRSVIEAHIMQFNEKNQLIKHEIQQVNNGLKTLITTYEYNELGKITAIETINEKGITERNVIANYNDKGLLLSEIKSEYEVAIGNINTFTLNYEYTFHQQ